MRFLVDSESGLLTMRSEGEANRLRIETELLSRQPDFLEIDFEGIQALTISFADEFLGRLLTELQSAVRDPIPLILTGLNEDTAMELDVVLERRRLLAVGSLGGCLNLLGGDEYLKSTFARATELRTFTAGRLAALIESSVQNVNNRLKRLVASGALQRARVPVDGGGREYEYRIPAVFELPTPA